MEARTEDRCFACGKRLRAMYGMHVVDTRDGQLVVVGTDCFTRIKAAGSDGYQPKSGGPRLWTYEHLQPSMCSPDDPSIDLSGRGER